MSERGRIFWWGALAVGSVAALVLLERKRAAGAGDSDRTFVWRPGRRAGVLPLGTTLRIVTPVPSIVHWTFDQWDTVYDTPTQPAGIAHAAELATESLTPGTCVLFTLYWPDTKRWEGEDYRFAIEAAGPASGGDRRRRRSASHPVWG